MQGLDGVYVAAISVDGTRDAENFVDILDDVNLDRVSLYYYLFIYLYRYLQLRVKSTQPMLSRAFRANIPTTKSQTGNILGVSGI